MMAVLEDTHQDDPGVYGEEVDLAHLPPDDPAVYAALQKADTIGMFQVESRAQMACLPRMQPDAVLRHRGAGGDHPSRADRRQDGASVSEPAAGQGSGRTACIPSLEPVLQRTLGVPLFQEQLLRMAMIAAGLHRRRGRGVAPRHGLQALGEAHGAISR